MKRLFAAILALCLLALPACGDAPVETTPMATTPTPTTPAPTTPAHTPPPEPKFVFSACTVPTIFATVTDLETYLQTGSADFSNYSQPPIGLYMMEQYSGRVETQYLALRDLFDLDDELFEYTEVVIQYGQTGGMRYSYYFDDIVIRIKSTYAESATDYLLTETTGYVSAIASVQSLDQAAIGSNGYVAYEADDLEIVYWVSNGAKTSAQFVIDDFVVLVQVQMSKDVSPQEALQEFLDNPAFSDMHALFSDDEQAVMTKMNEVKTSVENNDHVVE